MMKITSRLMACPCALTACRRRSATRRGDQSWRDDPSRLRLLAWCRRAQCRSAALSRRDGDERSRLALRRAHHRIWRSMHALRAARPAILRPLYRPNLHLRRQRAMDRTFIRDLQEPPALLRIELAAQCDGAIDAVDHPFLGLAILAIGGVDSPMADLDPHPLARQRPPPRVESKRHGRARSDPPPHHLLPPPTPL